MRSLDGDRLASKRTFPPRQSMNRVGSLGAWVIVGGVNPPILMLFAFFYSSVTERKELEKVDIDPPFLPIHQYTDSN